MTHKKNLRGTKFQLFVTGGNPFKNVSEPSTEFESELFRTIQVSVEGIDCAFDSNVISKLIYFLIYSLHCTLYCILYCN